MCYIPSDIIFVLLEGLFFVSIITALIFYFAMRFYKCKK